MDPLIRGGRIFNLKFEFLSWKKKEENGRKKEKKQEGRKKKHPGQFKVSAIAFDFELSIEDPDLVGTGDFAK
jgi:hypothetical protein